MTAKVSPTLKALHEIRNELRDVRTDLTGRIDNLETSMARELHAVSGAVLEVRDLLATRLDQRDQVADHEQRIRELERKTG